MKRIRQGNTINFRYSVYRSSGSLEEEEDLTGIEVTTSLQNRLYGTLVDVPFSVEGNVITGQIPGIPHLRTGVYNFCLSYQKDGTDFAVDTDAFQIVDSSSKTGGENTCPHVEAETVEVKGVVEFGVVSSGGIEQVQADWKESNEQSKAFIKNKPELKTVATSGSYNDLSDKPDIPTQLDVPTKTSQLTNDSGFISDTAYVHTDNNYTTPEKNKLEGIQAGAEANVNADWNATTGDAEILNKPVLSKVATSGSYNDLKDIPVIPGIPDVPTKTSDLENDSNFVSDPNYVHTDNNYSDEEKEKVAGLQNYDDTTLRTALQNEINRATETEGSLDAAVKKVASDLSNFITGSPDADDIINRWQEVTAFLNGITEDKTLSGMLLDLKKQIDESVTAKLSDYYTSVRVDELFVKKLVGSRLITEEEALKLAGLQNYDDTTVKASLQEEINRATEAENNLDAAIKKVASDFAAFLSTDPDADDLINRWQEVTAFLQGITEEKTLSGMLLGVKQEINESVTAKLADYYTSSRIDELFVKKLVGSRLITEEEATKLAGLQNYDDTVIVDRVDTLEGKQPIILDITDWYTLAYKTPNVKVPNLEIPSGWKELLEAGVNNGIRVTFLDQFGNINLYHATIVKHDISLGATMYRIYFHFIYPDRVMSFTIEVNYNKDGTPIVGSCILEYVLDISKKANAIEVRSVSDPNGANDVYAIDPNVFYDFDLVGEIHLSLTAPTDRNVYNEYMFQFIAAENNIPFAVDGVQWITEPEIKAGKTYQVSIVNNLAVIGGA